MPRKGSLFKAKYILGLAGVASTALCSSFMLDFLLGSPLSDATDQANKSPSWVESDGSFVFGQANSAPSNSVQADLDKLSKDSRSYRVSYATPNIKDDQIVVERNISEVANGVKSLERSDTIGSMELAVGAPVMPVDNVQLAIPAGKAVESIVVTPTTSENLPGKHAVSPAADLVLEEGAVTKAAVDKAAYAKALPNIPVGGVKTISKHGYDIVSINLYPVVHKDSVVSYYPSMDIKVSLKDAVESASKVTPKTKLAERQKEVCSIVDNCSELGAVSDEATIDPTKAVDYAIITDQALVEAFKPLVERKSQHGLIAKIFTIQEIAKDTGFAGDLQDKVRSFIANAYANLGTEYVLLGGNSDIIPERSSSDTSSHIPSDLYYAGLDGNWSHPSQGSDIDLASEVNLGRAPVKNTTEVANFVSKTLKYEGNGDSSAILFAKSAEIAVEQLVAVDGATAAVINPRFAWHKGGLSSAVDTSLSLSQILQQARNKNFYCVDNSGAYAIHCLQGFDFVLLGDPEVRGANTSSDENSDGATEAKEAAKKDVASETVRTGELKTAKTESEAKLATRDYGNTIVGTVLYTAGGTPVSGATVTLTHDNTNCKLFAAADITTQTGPSGGYSFTSDVYSTGTGCSITVTKTINSVSVTIASALNVAPGLVAGQSATFTNDMIATSTGSVKIMTVNGTGATIITTGGTKIDPHFKVEGVDLPNICGTVDTANGNRSSITDGHAFDGQHQQSMPYDVSPTVTPNVTSCRLGSNTPITTNTKAGIWESGALPLGATYSITPTHPSYMFSLALGGAAAFGVVSSTSITVKFIATLKGKKVTGKVVTRLADPTSSGTANIANVLVPNAKVTIECNDGTTKIGQTGETDATLGTFAIYNVPVATQCYVSATKDNFVSTPAASRASLNIPSNTTADSYAITSDVNLPAPAAVGPTTRLLIALDNATNRTVSLNSATIKIAYEYSKIGGNAARNPASSTAILATTTETLTSSSGKKTVMYLSSKTIPVGAKITNLDITLPGVLTHYVVDTSKVINKTYSSVKKYTSSSGTEYDVMQIDLTGKIPTYTFQGKVRFVTTDGKYLPISGAKVVLPATCKKVTDTASRVLTTDSLGRFAIHGVAKGANCTVNAVPRGNSTTSMSTTGIYTPNKENEQAFGIAGAGGGSLFCNADCPRHSSPAAFVSSDLTCTYLPGKAYATTTGCPKRNSVTGGLSCTYPQVVALATATSSCPTTNATTGNVTCIYPETTQAVTTQAPLFGSSASANPPPPSSCANRNAKANANAVKCEYGPASGSPPTAHLKAMTVISGACTGLEGLTKDFSLLLTATTTPTFAIRARVTKPVASTYKINPGIKYYCGLTTSPYCSLRLTALTSADSSPIADLTTELGYFAAYTTSITGYSPGTDYITKVFNPSLTGKSCSVTKSIARGTFSTNYKTLVSGVNYIEPRFTIECN